MAEFSYDTSIVCTKKITFSVEEGLVRNVKFHSGCPGSLQGIGKLVDGMRPEEIIERLKGINCGYKGTSCPDQLTKALKKYIAESSRQKKIS